MDQIPSIRCCKVGPLLDGCIYHVMPLAPQNFLGYTQFGPWLFERPDHSVWSVAEEDADLFCRSMREMSIPGFSMAIFDRELGPEIHARLPDLPGLYRFTAQNPPPNEWSAEGSSGSTIEWFRQEARKNREIIDGLRFRQEARKNREIIDGLNRSADAFRARVMSLYLQPFRWQRISGICPWVLADAAGSVVADRDPQGTSFSLRSRAFSWLLATIDGIPVADWQAELRRVFDDSGATAATTGEQAAECLTRFWADHPPAVSK